MKIAFLIFSAFLTGCITSRDAYPKIESFSTPMELLPRNTTETAEVLRNKLPRVEIITDEDHSFTKIRRAVTKFFNENENARVWMVKTFYSEQRLISVEIYYFEE